METDHYVLHAETGHLGLRSVEPTEKEPPKDPPQDNQQEQS